jgi:hypothetical protein
MRAVKKPSALLAVPEKGTTRWNMFVASMQACSCPRAHSGTHGHALEAVRNTVQVGHRIVRLSNGHSPRSLPVQRLTAATRQLFARLTQVTVVWGLWLLVRTWYRPSKLSNGGDLLEQASVRAASMYADRIVMRMAPISSRTMAKYLSLAGVPKPSHAWL